MNKEDSNWLEVMPNLTEANENVNNLLGEKEAAGGEEDTTKDLETFGDIGPLTNEWEDKHQQLALDIERGRRNLITCPTPTPSEAREKFDASQYAFFGGDGGDLGGLGDDDGALQDSNAYTLDADSEHGSETEMDGPSENMGVEGIASAFDKLNTGVDQTCDVIQGGVLGSSHSSKLSEQQNWFRTAGDSSSVLEHHNGNAEYGSWQSIPEQQQRQLYPQHRTPDAQFKQRTSQWWEEDGQGAPVPAATMHKQGSFQQPSMVPAATNAFQGRSMGVPMHGMQSQQQYPFLPGPPLPPGPSHWQLPNNGPGSSDPASLAHLSGVEMMMLQQHQRARPAPQVQSVQYRQPHQQQQRSIPMQADRHGLHAPPPHVYPLEPAAAPRHHYQAQGQNHPPQQQQRRHAAPSRAKYMSQEEIDNIMRIQWSATHVSDPYIDDYYHQAVQQKLTAATGTPHGRRHFAPNHLRDLPSHAKVPTEQPGFVSLHGLGRVPFANIRRPRPLLEVETQGSAAEGHNGLLKPPLRPLEQEPMLAARIAIEDGMCILLDVDDIDRMLSVSQQGEVGVQLRRQRQQLLEALGHTLQLVSNAPGMDCGPMLDGRGVPGGRIPGTKDDLVFLRLCSLPKGRKLLTRYLQLVPPGGELSRGVAMAVMRHLRFLFGGAQSDPFGSASSNSLARAVGLAGNNMDLPALSACLAAVVIASDHPPLRPMGAPAGDGATIILRALLDRATQILAERGGSTVPVQHQAMWQASFDAFFALLSKYCSNKFESIVNSMAVSSGGDVSAITVAAAAAMSKELPVEILWASLPHTNEHQRKLLLEFTQRSMNMGGFSSGMGNDGIQSAAPVCC